MKRSFRLFFIWFLPIFFISKNYAQSDFGSWIGASVKYPWSKKIMLGAEIQTRLNSNSSKINQSYISSNFRYEFSKFFRVEYNYRLSNIAQGDGFFGSLYYQRSTIDVEFTNILKLLKDKPRLSITARLRGVHEIQEGDLNSDYLRGKLAFKYNLPGTKLEPEISYETFFHFNDQLQYSFTSISSIHRFSKHRFFIGFDYPINKTQELNIFYIVQSPIESNKKDFIFGLGYTFKILKK